MSGNILQTVGQQLYKLAFEISPIVLVGGVASGAPMNLLPLVLITEAGNFVTGLLSGGSDDDLDGFFAHFKPIAGATLVDNEVGHYSFANQAVAANAIIANPLRISLRMDCPVQGPGGYTARLATMTALSATLALHSSQGGLFAVATPSYIYTNCVLRSLRDVTTGEGRQVQVAWQWDFEQPLVSLSGAAGALNTLMNKIGVGVPTDGAQSGATSTAGNITSGAAPVVSPASTNLQGVAVPGNQSAASGAISP